MPERARIGIGGVATESSTFSPLPTRPEDFTVLRGLELMSRYPFSSRLDADWRPCLYARALPGGPVTRVAYVGLKDELITRLRAELPLDGFYLDIHGAMFVTGMRDVEADLVEAIRSVIGPECLISASMDLHGNVSAQLAAQVDLFTAYRHAPHIDAEETRERACANLLRCLSGGIRPARAWVQIPVILPGERTSTLFEPARTLYARLSDVNEVIDASMWVGYVWADEPRSAATVMVTGTDVEHIKRESERLARSYWDARRQFGFCAPAGNIDWCIEEALAFTDKPVVISDSGDNPTGGGVGDTPIVVERLTTHAAFASGERTAIFASITDPSAVSVCASAGTGSKVSLSLGGKLDNVNAQPLPLDGSVETLRDSDPVGGRIAVVRTGGVHIIITSRRKPFHHLHDFTDLGLNPAEHDVVAVKIGYLEPELRQLAKCALLALTPGAVNQDIPHLTYRHVHRPIYPLDEDMPDPHFTAQVFPA